MKVLLVILLLLSWTSCRQRPPATDFTGTWPEGVERAWAGPDYWANRLQDWRVRNGQLECIESGPNRPLRTVHLLTRSLGDKPGGFEMSVRTGSLETGGEGGTGTWTGFLVGAGGNHVEYRISALAHQWPAEDGGLLAVVNGTGRAAFRDNSNRGEATILRGWQADAGWPELEGTSVEGPGFAGSEAPEMELTLSAEPRGGAYHLTLTARDTTTGALLSKAEASGVDPKQVEGSVALVSHLSRRQDGMGSWFRDWRLSGEKVVAHEDRAFGPVLAAQHTLSRGVLKLTAQMPPLGEQDTQTAELQVRHGPREAWRTVAAASLIEDSFTVPFRVENWDGSREARYRVVYDLRTADGFSPRYFEGTIRKEPDDRDTFVVAAFTGHKMYTNDPLRWNSNAIWWPHNELVDAVAHHNPDLLFFSGDQIYEGDIPGVQRTPLDKAILDYHYKWYRWCWAFRDLLRDIPAVTIPDDHDVYHGNIWGAGGRKAEAQDDGGYTMDAQFVNMVQRTQTSHLPDPFDPTPVEQGITVYYTQVNYAGMSFAVIEDRKWKSSPTVMIPEGKVVNGFFRNPKFDPAKQADVPGAELLGERQLRFLEQWAADWSGGAWMKVVLSQTLFANVATLPRQDPATKTDAVLNREPYLEPGFYPRDWVLAQDADSNGWPQTGRNKALRAMRKGFAVHISGDQHLASTIQYGVEDWDDAGWALCVPSVGNTWPRRWYPPQPGRNRKPEAPPYAGQFLDGFGNRVTVHAVANPVRSGHEPAPLHDRAPGYGIVRFERKTRNIRIECWPRYSDPSKPGAGQYPGWPIQIHQRDNYSRKPAAYLPQLQVSGIVDPVVQVVDQSNGEIVYTIRAQGSSFRPAVFRKGTYTVRIGDGERWLRNLEDVQSLESGEQKTIDVKL